MTAWEERLSDPDVLALHTTTKLIKLWLKGAQICLLPPSPLGKRYKLTIITTSSLQVSGNFLTLKNTKTAFKVKVNVAKILTTWLLLKFATWGRLYITYLTFCINLFSSFVYISIPTYGTKIGNFSLFFLRVKGSDCNKCGENPGQSGL